MEPPKTRSLYHEVATHDLAPTLNSYLSTNVERNGRLVGAPGGARVDPIDHQESSHSLSRSHLDRPFSPSASPFLRHTRSHQCFDEDSADH